MDNDRRRSPCCGWTMCRVRLRPPEDHPYPFTLDVMQCQQCHQLVQYKTTTHV